MVIRMIRTGRFKRDDGQSGMIATDKAEDPQLIVSSDEENPSKRLKTELEAEEADPDWQLGPGRALKQLKSRL